MNSTIPLRKLAFALILLAAVTAGCAGPGTTGSGPAPAAPQAVSKKAVPTYKGKIAGMSEKARTIAIKVGPETNMEMKMLRFDGKTTGTKFAKKDEAVTITYEMRGQEAYALTIKPNLAKLPAGVTEIKTGELQALLDKKTDLLVIDARPEGRYAQSHLPGAVSISVEKLEREQAAILPKDKEKLLVFYCGGPT